MRMSCNGCRVLRRGCSENCSLRPCLQWIKSPDSQANATVFLAKFYGRAALINLINVGPHHLRPAIFRSLLYEACGRIINPVNGSVGLMSSGNWQRCQEAVELVLKGSRIMQIPINDDDNTDQEGHPFKSCDIRHISKSSSNSDQLQVKIRNGRFKRKTTVDPVFDMMNEPSSQFSITGWDHVDGMEDELIRAQSHNSSSVEMGEPSLLLNCVGSGLPEENRDVGLELTLGS